MASTRDELRFTSRRPTICVNNAVVACAQPLAANVGIDILKAGGNAADAAVAVAAAMALTQPTTNGLGGDAFVLYYDAQSKQVRGLNGSGRNAAALTLQRVLDDGFNPDNPIPRNHGHAVTVPGMVAAMVDAHSNFGSGQMTLQQVLQPAIDLAEAGFPVTQTTSRSWELSEYLFLDPRNTHGGDMLINGRAPKWGEVFRNQHFADVLKDVAQSGKAGFYEGRVAQAIVNAVANFDGVMTLDDVRNHTSTLDTPINTTYGGYRLWEMPPNCHGIVALEALNIIESYDLKGMEHNSADYIHTLVEALKLAFADGLYYIADPSMVSVPVTGMLDKNYAATRRTLIDPNQAALIVTPGNPPGSSGPPAKVEPTKSGKDTIYFCVVDRQGNAVSWIQSNYAGVGTGIVPERCGFTLQNRGNGFSLEADHPNVIAPNKRPYHTIIPAMITRESTGDLLSTYGIMGGFMQPQAHLQCFLNMAVFGMDPQQAIDSPRFQLSVTQGSYLFSRISIEEGVEQGTIDGLGNKGHVDISYPVVGASRGGMGRGQIITKGAWWLEEERDDTANDSNVWWAGSDPRVDGLAIGY